MSSSPVPPGVTLAKIEPMNGTTPQNAAFNNMQDRNNYLSRLTNPSLSGGRRAQRKYKGGSWVAPQIRTIYTDPAAPGQRATDVSDKMAAVQAQNQSYKKYDSLAQEGGRRRRKTRRLRRGRGHSSRRRQSCMSRQRRRHGRTSRNK